jgi:hypothetical protein
MHYYTIYMTTGSWRVLAKSTAHARLMAAEFEPDATVLRIERDGEW